MAPELAVGGASIHHRRMNKALLGFVVTAGSALAVAGLPAQGADRGRRAPQLPKRLFVDSVVASVNDSAILQSRLFATTSGSILGAEAQAGRPLSLGEVGQMTMRDLQVLISNYQMAQAARSFGNIPPERFDMMLEMQLEQDKEQRMRDLGGYGELSAELERTGQTWRSYADSQRLEKLQDIAESLAIYDRLRKQSNLYLTPRMLRDTYAQNRDLFIRPAKAQVAMVTFRGPDASAHAKEASDLWADKVLTAREVANRYPGSIPLRSMRAKSLQPRLRDFALAGPAGNVSPPIRRANGMVDVVKVTQFAAARNGKFEDAEVQVELRRIAANQVLIEFQGQAQLRARERTEVWIYKDGRRIRGE